MVEALHSERRSPSMGFKPLPFRKQRRALSQHRRPLGGKADKRASLLEIINAQGRGKACRAKGREDVARPREIISQHFRRMAPEENGASVTNIRQQRLRVIHGKLKVLWGDAINEGHPQGQARHLNQARGDASIMARRGRAGSAASTAASTASSRAGSGLTKMA